MDPKTPKCAFIKPQRANAHRPNSFLLTTTMAPPLVSSVADTAASPDDQVAPASKDASRPPSRAASAAAESPTTPTPTTPAKSRAAPPTSLKEERRLEGVAQQELADAVLEVLGTLDDEVWNLKEGTGAAARAWVKRLWDLLGSKVRRRALRRVNSTKAAS